MPPSGASRWPRRRRAKLPEGTGSRDEPWVITSEDEQPKADEAGGGTSEATKSLQPSGIKGGKGKEPARIRVSLSTLRARFPDVDGRKAVLPVLASKEQGANVPQPSLPGMVEKIPALEPSDVWCMAKTHPATDRPKFLPTGSMSLGPEPPEWEVWRYDALSTSDCRNYSIIAKRLYDASEKVGKTWLRPLPYEPFEEYANRQMINMGRTSPVSCSSILNTWLWHQDWDPLLKAPTVPMLLYMVRKTCCDYGMTVHDEEAEKLKSKRELGVNLW